MKLVMTLLVRDEIDVIRTMLDFHLHSGVDHIIVTDNGSVDGTLDILYEYEQSGRVLLLHEPPSDFSQHRWVSRMAHLAQDVMKADWIIHADADELFVPLGSGNLKQALAAVDTDLEVLKIQRHDFVACERNNRAAPQLEMTFRKSKSLNLAGNPLPPKVIHRPIPDIKVAQGNHGVRSAMNLEIGTLDSIAVFHYPIRSYAQFRSKVSNGGSGYARNHELDIKTGHHKRYWYQFLMEGKLEGLYYKEYFFSESDIHAGLSDGSLTEDYTVTRIMMDG